MPGNDADHGTPLSPGDSGHGGLLSFICRQRVLRPCNMHPIKLFRDPQFEPRWAVEDTYNCLHAGLAGLDSARAVIY
jgi:hypothetical protein